MRVGDKVRLVALPPALEDFPDMPTTSTFQRCVGDEFTVNGITGSGWAELQIESVTGNTGEKIYVAPSFLKVI